MAKDGKSETTFMRGARSFIQGRFETVERETFDDGWTPEEKDERPLETQVTIERARSIVSHNDSPDVGFDSSINPYRGCEHGCIYCLHGDTLVLMADGTARRIADLKVGEQVCGTRLEEGQRRYTRSRVRAHWTVVRPAYQLTLADGTEIVAGGDHRFLSHDGWKFVAAADAGTLIGTGGRPHLTAGDMLMGPGSALLANNVVVNGMPRRGGGLRAAEPSGIYARDLLGQPVSNDPGLRVASIEQFSDAIQLYDITTETEDFIANGVVSHNCYARPSHAYLELSPGLDFETKLFAKTNAPELLRAELAKPGYKPSPIALGANTDCYQPIERKYRITRQILEVLAECKHPVTIVTKSALVERDLDLLSPMAAKNLVRVFVSIGTLDRELARKLEPRAASHSLKRSLSSFGSRMITYAASSAPAAAAASSTCSMV
ncbi:MAG TPA: hypothetical protein VGJ74_04565, partial [Burkholderiales bacterium]